MSIQDGIQADNTQPGPIQKRRESVSVGFQADIQVDIQADIPQPGAIQQRRQSVTVGVQVEISPPEPELWCCRQPEADEMILCDNPDCMIQWFHLDCIRMEAAPEGDWYYANCSFMLG